MISITAFLPLWVDARSAVQDILPVAYSHEIDASVGFTAASLTFYGHAAEWFNNGLGRHIEVYDEGGQVCFEGFVNKVIVAHGAITSERGPLLEVANRALTMYTTMDFDVDPPVSGGPAETAIAESEESQLKYGIIERAVSAGQSTDDAAEQVRDAYLEDNREPKSLNSLAVPGGTYTQITLDIQGYAAWFGAYIYTNIGGTGLTFVSDKIITLRNADPNGLFSTDDLYIEDNLFPTPNAEFGNRYAGDILRGLLALGAGGTDNRMLFGVFEERKLHYYAFPTELYYQHYLYSTAQSIQTLDGATILPWNVRAGRWLTVPDFMIGWEDADLMANPRNLFVERVTYTHPFTVSLEGSNNQRLSQMLAKISYTGGWL